MSRALRRRLLMALTASVVAMGATVRAQEPQFRLLLGIVVEGLDDAGLELLRDKFGGGGFRMLSERGLYIPVVDYGTPLDLTAATAMVVSGAEPALSGIDADMRFDRDRLRYGHIFADPSTIGNFTSQAFSPMAMRVSTLSDEARISGAGMTAAYAVAATPGQAIALGGHTSNVALWIDPTTGNWASSAFYREMPTVVASRNRTTPLAARMDTMSWAPLGGSEVYTMLPEHLSRYAFRYVFPRSNPARLDMFLSSPFANREVTAVACDLLNAGKLGTHEAGVDVLNVGYSLAGYPYGRNSDKRLEQFDATLRLDGDIEKLFRAVDSTVGLDHTLVYVAGTPSRQTVVRDDPQWNIPYGEFSARRAVSLLNMYLIALHGNGDYIAAFHGGNLYLNAQLLKDKGLNAADVRAEVATLLCRMNGVDRAHTLERVLDGTAGDRGEAVRRNTTNSSVADVSVTICPGFELIDDFETATVAAEDAPTYVRRSVAPTAPVFIMAPTVESGVIETPVDARAIAPTVARQLRIRSPNGATVPAIRLPAKQ